MPLIVVDGHPDRAVVCEQFPQQYLSVSAVIDGAVIRLFDGVSGGVNLLRCVTDAGRIRRDLRREAAAVAGVADALGDRGQRSGGGSGRSRRSRSR